MDATGVAVNCQREEGSARNRTSAWRSAASSIPRIDIHNPGNIAAGSARKVSRRLRVPAQSVVARLAQHRRIVELRVAADGAADHA